ncbi:TPA_asm: coat protein [ssRNA phage Gerhypos.1_49]|uniref:Coat protein n=2 Tax=Fiersviridae TaxID=2842319 RepID=A0A8S5KY69_9VIRU|nr:coat protein [ssRNA phage Gerhypos.1_49]QDH88245.1 MAG: hypothetical protein H1Bulk30345_000002 [Leviviridae sp.]QDH89600.1 MAG: hypothetical protein H3RhizoLitter15392_000002 [Leviviridae sp.]DAD50124.1 TPA_asm: coat protein [ssRNA phage Gerhypos.1_49]
MPAIASISLVDGQPTPTTRVFAPVGIDSNQVASYENRATGIAVGYDGLSIGMRRPTKGSRNYKHTVRLLLPTLEVTSPSTATGIQPAPSKAYDSFVNVEFVNPERGTAQNRKDLVTLLRNALVAGGVIDVCVQNLESVY